MINRIQLSHRLRWLKQKLISPKVAIIGGYHGGNLGDMALGTSIKLILESKKISAGLQTIYNLEKWPKLNYAIVGGGAVGYNDSLVKVYSRYKNDFSKIAFIGVDFNESRYSSNIVKMLSEAAYVSCRSKVQAKKMKEMTGRDDINFHPDIAYSLDTGKGAASKNIRNNKHKKLLVNVVPLYGSYLNNSIIPLVQYQNERPELFQNFDAMHKNYFRAIRLAVEEALDDDYIIETIPFTPQDEAFGRYLLRGLKVRHHTYHDKPFKMLKNMLGADSVIPTRLHATIFAIKAGASIRPIAYAAKNVQMFEEAGVNGESFLTSGDLASGRYVFPPAITVDNNLAKVWKSQATAQIYKCIDTLIDKGTLTNENSI